MSAPGSHHWSQKLRIQRRQWRSVVEPSEGWSGIECILRLHIQRGIYLIVNQTENTFFGSQRQMTLKVFIIISFGILVLVPFKLLLKVAFAWSLFVELWRSDRGCISECKILYIIWLTCCCLPELLMELTLCILCSLLASRNLSDWSLFRPSFLPVGEVGEIPFSGCDCVWSSGISPGNFRLSFLVRHWNPFSQIRYF